MYSVIWLFLLFAVIRNVVSNDECNGKCVEHFTNEEDVKNCNEGCRLALIYKFALGNVEDRSSLVNNCHNGCVISFKTPVEIDACSYGCDHLPSSNDAAMRVSISNQSPTFGVAQDLFSKIFSRFPDSFPSFGFGSSHEEINDDWGDPFAEMRRRIQLHMARMQEVANHFFNKWHTVNEGSVHVSVQRPQGHMVNAFIGPNVDNLDKNGGNIIEEVPLSQNIAHNLAYKDESSPAHSEPSWLSRIATRARRLSLVSQCLIAIALFICIISLISIMLAIAKQIRSLKYQNLHNVRAFVATSVMEPPVTKKVPVDHSAAAIDYPLIHDTPPPAYDQLSIHKDIPPKTDESA